MAIESVATNANLFALSAPVVLTPGGSWAQSLIIRFDTVNLAEMQQGSYAANDRPLPIPLSVSIPLLSGNQWGVGTIFTFTFGTLAAEDSAYLAGLAGTIGTITIYVNTSGWRRVTGAFTWSSPMLSLTTSASVTIEPWVTPI